jgi:hypothetical protein
MISQQPLHEFYAGIVPPDQTIPEGYVFKSDDRPFAHIHLLEDEYAFFWIGTAEVRPILATAWQIARDATQFLNARVAGFRTWSDWLMNATCVRRHEGKAKFLEVARPIKMDQHDRIQLARAFDRSPLVAIHINLELERRKLRLWANVADSGSQYPEVGLAADVPLLDAALQLFGDTCKFEDLRKNPEVDFALRTRVNDLMQRAFQRRA